ncbi:hypothetical protein ACUOA8_56735, partial [Escherichia sp. SS-MK2]
NDFIIISVNPARSKVLCTVDDSFNCYDLGGYGSFTPHQWCFFKCELPVGLPLLTIALVGLILGLLYGRYAVSRATLYRWVKG